MRCVMKNPSHYPSPAFSLIVFAFLMFAGGTLASAQRYKVLYTFKGGSDGFGAGAAVIFDKEGALYSTAGGGNGTPCSCGVVFKLAPPTSPGGARTETVLYAFNGGVDGGEPVGALIFRNAELFVSASRG